MSKIKQQEFLSQLTPEQLLELRYTTDLWLRSDQVVPYGGEWRHWLIQAGRGFGKDIALDTAIPTPHGWTTMGDLQPGDRVFDERGQACNVVSISEVFTDHKCYRLTFDDGTQVIAGEDHLWFTWTKAARKSYGRAHAPTIHPAVIDTKSIAATLRVGKDANHSVPCAAPLHFNKQTLPIDPYLLGVWLGDGTASSGAIECADTEILTHIAADGYHVVPSSRCDNSKSCSYRVHGLTQQLSRLNLLCNKHIPLRYIMGSVAQRLALLQGLMDTDGCADARGYLEFSNCNAQLARQTFELMLSLGIKATISSAPATLYGRIVNTKWRIHASTHLPVFRLSRKLKRQQARSGKRQKTRSTHRYIVAIEAVPSVPTKCITVDSPSHLYLITKHCVATHNTYAGAAWLKKCIENHKAIRGRHDLYTMVAPTHKDLTTVMIPALLAMFPPSERDTIIWNKNDAIITFPNRAVLYGYSSEVEFRGPNIEFAWADELAKWCRPDEQFDLLQKAVRIGRSQTVTTTTPKKTIKTLRTLAAIHEKAPKEVVIVHGSSLDNPYLTEKMRRELMRSAGSNNYRQEVLGELLSDSENALFEEDAINRNRVTPSPDAHPLNLPAGVSLIRIIVAVDPAGTTNPESDETGIVVVGLDEKGHAYVLEDASGKYPPDKWARRAVELYNRYSANLIVAERNFGGDMVEHTLKTVDPHIAFKAITASHGKLLRAEPIASKYAQNLVHHVGAAARFERLEDQMTYFTGAPSTSKRKDDRLDSLVFALTELMISAAIITRNFNHLPFFG